MGDILDTMNMLGLMLGAIGLMITGVQIKNDTVIQMGFWSAILFGVLFELLFIRTIIVKLEHYKIIPEGHMRFPGFSR
ncbi:MAG: hypothetical protein AABX23_02190 [Nanoarchaeota archaeon]